MADFNYIPNGGQTYIPFRENVHVPQPEFTPLGRPQPPLPDFQLTHEAQDKGWVVASPCQHFLPGVEPEMLDWWWANMEKGYYLWAPAAHKRFNWVRSPGEAGFLASSHMISEAMVPAARCLAEMGCRFSAWGWITTPLRPAWATSSWRVPSTRRKSCAT